MRNAQPNGGGWALQRAGARFAWNATGLSASGTVAALLVGSAAVVAGWRWAVVLLVYFAAATVVSRRGRAAKIERAGATIDKPGVRDAAQVLANGAAYTFAALAHAFGAWPGALAFGLGALAASSADTWATELGLLSPRAPRHIATLRAVESGVSGAVTARGTLGGIAGATVVAAAVAIVGWPGLFVAVAAGGVAGMLLDSLLGATIQERRWCNACGRATEALSHTCGARTARRGGVPGFRNDAVNLAATIGGGAIALLVSA